MCFIGHYNAQLWVMNSSVINYLQSFVFKTVSTYAIQASASDDITRDFLTIDNQIVTACFHSSKSLASGILATGL